MNEITKQLLSELHSLVNGIEELQNRARYLLGIVQGVAFAEEVKSKENNQYQNKNCLVIEEGGVMKYDGKKITKTADGKLWWARLTANKKTYAVYAKTQKECYDKFKKFVDNAKKGKLPAKNESINTYGEWLRKWIEVFEKPNLKDSSYRNKKGQIKLYLENSNLSKKSLKEITALDIQELILSIPYSKARQKIYYIINGSFKTAVESNLLKRNPCVFIKKPAHISASRRAMTREEQSKFIEAIQHSKYKLLYELMLFQGLRSGEARAFRHCDISKDRITIAVSIDDNGNECTTKTNKERVVPIFPQMAEELNKLRKPSNERIFKNSNKHTGQREFNKIIAGLGMNYDMYELRHTFGTRCAESGIDVKQIAQWMGHSDSSTTLKYYTHINKEYENENVIKVGKYLEKNIQSSIQDKQN